MVLIKEKREEGGEDGMNLKIMAEMPARRRRLACPPHFTSF